MNTHEDKEGTQGRIILVGTYKGNQLTRWRGWYCWPVSNEELKMEKGELKANGTPANSQFSTLNFQFINELWLFKGKEERATYKAEFVGVKTREELVRDYGYPAKGKAHGDWYLLFKTESMYALTDDDSLGCDRVIIRTRDFATSPKIRKQLKAYLESPDRSDPNLANMLPEIVVQLPPERLFVCEGAVQLTLDFLSPSPLRGNADGTHSSFSSVEAPIVIRQTVLSALSAQDITDRLFQGDCIQILPHFPAGAVDLILCDLPYGTTQNKWDSVIPLDLLWAEYMRVLKPGGVVVLTSQGVFTAKLILSNPEWFKYKLVWVKSKPTNFLNAKVQPLRKHEDVCVFYQRRCTYNPVMGEGVPYDKGVRKNQLSGSYGDFRPVHVQSDGKRYPTDVVYFKTAESEGEVWHPTQKPVGLGRYLVKTFSNPGDLVLDNAFGSGSFLLAAALENRHFVGIEKNESVALFKDKAIDYIDVAASRLNCIIQHREVS